MIVDLHLHSKYSYATSKDLDLAGLYLGAKKKGIDVLGTGDFTHPAWFQELSENLVKTEAGLYQLQGEITDQIEPQVPTACRNRQIYFIPTVEVSCVYRRYDLVRKVHLVVVLPDLEKASELNKKLSTQGNLSADGRPTFGLDSVELLKIVLDISEEALLIPAHIWTPWFGLFGSQSGFDSLEEAFGDMKSEIYAIETGLSSDPYMNWRVGDLEGLTLVSNSDAHSTRKLGREANLIETGPEYREIIEAIKTGDERFVGTVEFFPQEGKYHSDGHRKCDTRMEPIQTKKHDGVCPQCGRQMTIGVLNRVDQLSTKELKAYKSDKKVEYIIPLTEIIAQVLGYKHDTGKSVQKKYQQMLEEVGDEFSLLRSVEIKTMKSAGYPDIAKAIDLMRRGEIEIEPGYDGVYGRISLPLDSTKEEQMSLL